MSTGSGRIERIRPSGAGPVTLCAMCGLEVACPILDAEGLPIPVCPHHIGAFAVPETWATDNKAACDLLHRGKVPPPAPPVPAEEAAVAQQEVGFWT